MKRVITVEDLSASPNGKRGGLGKKSAVVKINKQATMECEGAGIEKKTASHKVTTGGKSGKEDKATASRVMLEELECDEPWKEKRIVKGKFSRKKREKAREKQVLWPRVIYLMKKRLEDKFERET